MLSRLLDAVLNFQISSPEHEVIIVDNNSLPALAEQNAVVSFLNKKKNSLLLTEQSPGLTASRVAGIKHSKNDWLIFFDDDNEPCSDYLIETSKLIVSFPKVGAWGPGDISVQYTDANKHQWLEKYKIIFQEKHMSSIAIASDLWWQNCYPVGTGLIILRCIGNEYVERVINGRYLLSDRKGKSLSSGGDVQLVLTSIVLNYGAGVSPTLKLTHIIDQKKSNLRYLMLHAFGTAASNLPAHAQVVGLSNVGLTQPTNQQIIKQFYYCFKVIAFNHGYRHALTKFAHYLGEQKGIYQVRKDFKETLYYKAFKYILRLQ